MTNQTTWYAVTTTNAWTGETNTRHLRQFTSDSNQCRVYTEVYRIGDRWYWLANIHIPFQPKISKMAYGSISAAASGSLAVAKMRASRIALASLRKAGKHTLAA